MTDIMTGNQQLVKQINKKLVLESVIKQEPISRADISQRVGLNKGTVSSLVSELIEEQFIYESGPGKSSGGRRPVMLLYNQNAGYAIGIDLGVNYILGLLTDLKGNKIVEINKKITVHHYEEILLILQKMIEDLIDSSPMGRYGIVGIGIGVPGLVTNSNKILVAPNLGWKDIELQKIIEDTFNIPVFIENEANAGAYGERIYGAGKNYNNIMYVSAGIGIGIGSILDGKLFTGMNGFSGEMGHMVIQVGGKDCSCGSSGCWELYASERALLDEALKAKLPHVTKETLTIELLLNLAENGNEDVINIFNTIGMYLGVGISNIINSFNPELIIIGNRLAMAEKWLEKPIKKYVNVHAMDYHQKGLSIQFSHLYNDAAALGVAALSIENFIKNKVI